VSTLSHWHGIIKRGTNNASGNFQFYVRNDSEVYLNWSGSSAGSAITTSGANIQTNTWYWLQIIRSSGTVNIYVNGVSKASFSDSSNISSTTYYDIGGWTSYYSDALIRDLRVSTVARSSSTGPSDKLEVDSDTTFLTCNSPYVTFSTPSAVNNYVQYISGPVSIEPLSPYDYEEYDAADHGGSVYFDGTGDALRIADNSNIQLGTSSFTIEGWFYCNDTTNVNSQGILAKRDGSSEYWRWIIAGGNLNFRFQSAGGGSFTCNTVSVPAKTWCHFAVTRDSNNDVRQFVNGISTQNAINSTGNFDISGSSLRVGEFELNTGHFNGFVSDIKIIKNSALYTTDFTPPTAPLSSSGTSLHIKGTDASIIDKSQGTNLLIDGTTITGVSTGSKYSKAIKNTAASSAIKVCTPSEFNMRTNDDFTIEFWFKVDPTSSYSAIDWPKYILQILYGGIVFGIWANPSTTKIEGLGARTDGSSYITWSSSSFTSYTPNQWHHYALSFDKSNTTAKWFLDGSLYHTDTSYDDPSTSVTNSNGTYMVSLFGVTGTVSSNTTFIGSIEDFRFSQFTRYTANFTPPTESLEG